MVIGYRVQDISQKTEVWCPFTGCYQEHAGEEQRIGPENRGLRNSGAL